jgi:hypothetical protein
MIDLNAEIQARVASFAAGLAPLIRQAAIDAVSAALGGTAVSRKRTRRAATARPVAKAARTTKAPSTAKRSRQAKGAKRDPKALAALVERLHRYVKQHPGQRMEHIKAGLGLSKSELVLPIKKLLADKRISAKGIKRSTQYTAK